MSCLVVIVNKYSERNESKLCTLACYIPFGVKLGKLEKPGLLNCSLQYIHTSQYCIMILNDNLIYMYQYVLHILNSQYSTQYH